jgi:excisionase family DNA binding protein
MYLSIKGMDMAKTHRGLATRTEVAEYLGVPTATVNMWAHRGKGPKYVRIGRHARYRWADVEAWLDQQTQGGQAA